MLEATKTSIWKGDYAITLDGQPLVTWDPSIWLNGGTVVMGEDRYRVKGATFSSTYSMESADGVTIASARKVGRKSWTIEAGGVTYEFRRTSMWSSEQELVTDTQRVGYVKKAGFWSTGAVADLPGMPLPLQVFSLAVILTMWARNTSAAAGGAAAATGAAASG